MIRMTDEKAQGVMPVGFCVAALSICTVIDALRCRLSTATFRTAATTTLVFGACVPLRL